MAARRLAVLFPPRIRFMPLKIFSFIALALVLLLAGGAAFLVVWEPKAPTHVIERTIPDDKLPR